MRHSYDVTVVGGGFYGTKLASSLALLGKSVLLLEERDKLLSRASYNNQARIHGGYHYPRSFPTADRSRKLFPNFIQHYREVVNSSFEKLYAIAKPGSFTSSKQFVEFCKRIGAPIKLAPAAYKKWFDSRYIQDLFIVEEFAFNADMLRLAVMRELDGAGVEVQTSAKALKATPARREFGEVILEVEFKDRNNDIQVIRSRDVIVCAYSKINEFLENSGLPRVALKHEMTEMPLVEVPEELKNVGITVMDGPFFSLMPFPARHLHSFSHVRYTPHWSWSESANKEVKDARNYTKPTRSHFNMMQRDVVRLMPLLGELKHVDSLWEVKSVMPRSEQSDSRPILFRSNHGISGVHVVLGAKIDNVFDALDEANSIFRR